MTKDEGLTRAQVEITKQLMADVERLRAANADLLEALRPFADIALSRDRSAVLDMIDAPDLSITPDNVRRARAAIAKATKNDEQNTLTKAEQD